MSSTAVFTLSFTLMISFSAAFDHELLYFFDTGKQGFLSMLIPKDLMHVFLTIL